MILTYDIRKWPTYSDNISACQNEICMLNPSTPTVPNCCCSKASAPYWSNQSTSHLQVHVIQTRPFLYVVFLTVTNLYPFNVFLCLFSIYVMFFVCLYVHHMQLSCGIKSTELSPERQSARMSKMKNGWLDQYDKV